MVKKTAEKTSLAGLAETAIVKKPKKETSIVKKERAQTAVMKKEKAQTAVMKKEKKQTAVVKREKAGTAVVKKEKKQTAVVKKKVSSLKRTGMEYIDIVNFVRDRLKTIDENVLLGKAAYQIDVTGQGKGIFYIEIADGFLAVEPYDYRDRNVRFELSSDVLLDLMEGVRSFDEALAEGRLGIEGDWDKTMEFRRLVGHL